MRLTGIDTFRFDEHANVLILRIRTDEGLVGLGETFFDPASVESHVHERLAPSLLGRAADDPLSLNAVPTPYVGLFDSGVEVRARSALNIATWDLLGRMTGQPVARLLGGQIRDDIEIYNTCAGPGYVQGNAAQGSHNWGIDDGAVSQYEDLRAFLERPAQLAAELVAEGISGMKIWPFDTYSERHGGRHIEADELAHGVAAVEAIRAEVGDAIDVMVELHSLWDLPTATRIAHALEDLNIRWIEDPISPGQPEALARLGERTSVPVAGGEVVAGAANFRRLFAAGAYDVPIVDPGWVGGLTEARNVAALASTYGLPIATHDCTGPIALAACVHLSLSQPNALIQETVRALYRTWYGDLVTGLPPIDGGRISGNGQPGLGVELVAGLEDTHGVEVRTSELES